MSLELVRVDDRLIHGQVVVGWGRVLNPDVLVLADDEVAQNDWEQELYRMGVPPEIEVEFTSVADAAVGLEALTHDARRAIVLVGDVASLRRLCDGAPSVRKVNLGGVHREGDRRQRLPYLFLDEREAAELRLLEARGIEITAQDLPSAAPIPLAEVL